MEEAPICFISAEFAIDNDLPTYAGGLGILAADILNEAADEELPMVGVGILYKGKEYIQHITGEGIMETRDSEFDHDTSFLRPALVDGKATAFTLNFQGKEIQVKAYKVRLSQKVVLYFLSTDVDGNPPEWVSDMDALYRGDTQSQIRQQLLLGIGGVKLMNTLGIKPKLYHINEGRPSFIIWELVSDKIKSGREFTEAWNETIKQIVYTNHTLVSAGNLMYPKSELVPFATDFATNLGVDPELLIKDGLIPDDTFSITQFALNISCKHSSVSKVHGEYCKKEWKSFKWEVITNGVHMGRWQDSDYRNPRLTDRQIWEQHMIKKRELLSTVVKRTGIGYDPERLVVTWARRLAEYKQPKLIFSDIKRLKAILQNSGKEVQLLYAGNSHTGDERAKSIIEEIIHIFSTELSGNAIFVPNYNISLANHLTSGSDIWLNTPAGNLEACGTSGMKALSNGVLQCTVLDGWTYEVDWTDVGWVLPQENTAHEFYSQMENEIISMFYRRNDENLPYDWITRMKKSITIAKTFSATRMLAEYKKKLYSY